MVYYSWPSGPRREGSRERPRGRDRVYRTHLAGGALRLTSPPSPPPPPPPSRHDELTRRIRGSGRQFNVLLHNLTSRIRGEGIKPDGGKGGRGGEKGRGVSGGGGVGEEGVSSSPRPPPISPPLFARPTVTTIPVLVQLHGQIVLFLPSSWLRVCRNLM